MISVKSAQYRDFFTSSLMWKLYCGHFFLKHGGYLNKSVKIYLILLYLTLLFQSWSVFRTFSHGTGFTDLVETEQRGNVWACFCRSLHSDGKSHTIALKNRWKLQFSSKSVQTPISYFALLDNTSITSIKCLLAEMN